MTLFFTLFWPWPHDKNHGFIFRNEHQSTVQNYEEKINELVNQILELRVSAERRLVLDAGGIPGSDISLVLADRGLGGESSTDGWASPPPTGIPPAPAPPPPPAPTRRYLPAHREAHQTRDQTSGQDAPALLEPNHSGSRGGWREGRCVHSSVWRSI